MLKKISSYVIVLAIGLAVGTWFDAKHTIEEKVVVKDRVRTVTQEIIVERPDGSKETRRTVEKNEKTDTKTAKKETIPLKKDWGVGVKADLFNQVPVYTVEIHRRVFSDLYVSAYGRTNNTVGLGVTFFF